MTKTKYKVTINDLDGNEIYSYVSAKIKKPLFAILVKTKTVNLIKENEKALKNYHAFNINNENELKEILKKQNELKTRNENIFGLYSEHSSYELALKSLNNAVKYDDYFGPVIVKTVISEVK